MKHNWKVTAILIGMFLVAQIIGILVNYSYSHQILVGNQTANIIPFGMQPPEIDAAPGIVSIIMSFVIAIALIFILMKFKAATFLRIWFFYVVIIAIGVVINLILVKLSPNLGINHINLGFIDFTYSEIIAFLAAIPFAIYKVFKRNMIIHNLSELLIYPGISVVFIPILNLWTISILLVLISAYDIYAVWHSGFMQKMAKYQINELKFFAGFFVPYIRKEDLAKMKAAKNKKGKGQKIKISMAILGGGDVVFPIITSGVVLLAWGLLPALMVTLGATIALGLLLYMSEKGKFYPAMPFVSAGIFAGMLVGWLLV